MLHVHMLSSSKVENDVVSFNRKLEKQSIFYYFTITCDLKY